MILSRLVIIASACVICLALQANKKRDNYGTSFYVDFLDETNADNYFVEDSGLLTTDGSYACMRPDHLHFNETLDDFDGRHGLVIHMDNIDATECSSKANISTGHLSSISYYTYGDFEIFAKIAHSPNGSDPPSNAFTCFSAYVGTTTAAYHNEIAICFSMSNISQIHFGYWVGYDGDVEHLVIKDLGFDASQSYHKYGFQWRPEAITWLMDDKVLATSKSGNMPWEPMSIRVILRPKNNPTVYLGDALFSIASVAYTRAEDVSYVEPTIPPAANGLDKMDYE